MHVKAIAIVRPTEPVPVYWPVVVGNGDAQWMTLNVARGGVVVGRSLGIDFTLSFPVRYRHAVRRQFHAAEANTSHGWEFIVLVVQHRDIPVVTSRRRRVRVD